MTCTSDTCDAVAEKSLTAKRPHWEHVVWSGSSLLKALQLMENFVRRHPIGPGIHLFRPSDLLATNALAKFCVQCLYLYFQYTWCCCCEVLESWQPTLWTCSVIPESNRPLWLCSQNWSHPFRDRSVYTTSLRLLAAKWMSVNLSSRWPKYTILEFLALKTHKRFHWWMSFNGPFVHGERTVLGVGTLLISFFHIVPKLWDFMTLLEHLSICILGMSAHLTFIYPLK